MGDMARGRPQKVPAAPSGRVRVTSADVAREAGLSRATVSYVLNDTPNQKIPESTRQRVLEAAERLQYAPSAAARALRTGRSDVVLCLLPSWPIGESVGSVLEQLSAALAERGMTFVVHPRPPVGHDVAKTWRTITPAAVLAFEEFTDEEVQAMRAAGIAETVVLMGPPRGPRLHTLELPEQRVGRIQAEHLAVRGHRRLGYAFPDDERVRAFAERRLEGARYACAELGLDEPDVQTLRLDADSAAAAVAAWRDRPEPVTGVCAYNDEMAAAVLAGMRRHGLRAPGDLAVVGVDDIATAPLLDPPLTTVTRDVGAMARHLAARTIAAIEKTPEPTPLGSDFIDLVVRESA
jgi:DNA-binding LacI/PurR family transcriptional regulator